MIFSPGGSIATLSSTATPSILITPDLDGLYRIQLIVNDGKVDSYPAVIEIIVSTPNSPPIANAGVDQNVSPGAIVTLDGSNSNDPNGDHLTYNWSFVSIPHSSSTILSNPNGMSPTFTADIEGIYELSLVVNDGIVDSIPDFVIVQVSPPTVTTFVLPAGENAIYLLKSNFGGPNEYVDISIIDFQHQGTIFSLSANVSPIGDVFTNGNKSIIFTTTDSIGFGSGGITYTGRLSFSGYTITDNENFKIATVVNFENSNSSYVRFRDVGNGIYRVEVDVYDVFGSTDGVDQYQDYDDMVFLIGSLVNLRELLGPNAAYELNSTPIASAGHDQRVVTGSVVTLDGSASNDTDGGQLTYAWSFISKPEGSTATLSDPTATTPTFTTDRVGTYVVSLEVTDGIAVGIDSVTITVVPSIEVKMIITDGYMSLSPCNVNGTININGFNWTFNSCKVYGNAGNPISAIIINNTSETYTIENLTVHTCLTPGCSSGVILGPYGISPGSEILFPDSYKKFNLTLSMNSELTEGEIIFSLTERGDVYGSFELIADSY